jgi:hypothetical protein
MFFFLDYEGTRINQAQTDFASVPTDGTNGTSNERTGDFSGILDLSAPSGVDPAGRPVYANEIYEPFTTCTVNGVTVRKGFGFDCNNNPIAGRANVIPAGYAGLSSLLRISPERPTTTWSMRRDTIR